MNSLSKDESELSEESGLGIRTYENIPPIPLNRIDDLMHFSSWPHDGLPRNLKLKKPNILIEECIECLFVKVP